jgi:hypothetical protein
VCSGGSLPLGAAAGEWAAFSHQATQLGSFPRALMPLVSTWRQYNDCCECLEEAIRLHRDRYRVAEMIYLAEVCPRPLFRFTLRPDRRVWQRLAVVLC